LKSERDSLKRRKYLGVTFENVKKSVYVSNIVDTYNSFQINDKIIEFEGLIVEDAGSLSDMINKLNIKDYVNIKIERRKEIMLMKCKLLPYPKEEKAGILLKYNFFIYRGAKIRTIVSVNKSKKNTEESKNILLFVQGIECDSVDMPLQSHPYKKILYSLTKNDLMTARIDLYGNGDSEGAPCYTYDFYDILNLYKSAVYYFINEGLNVYILGYSIGGFIAPMIAEAIPEIKGIAVFDTIVTSLYSYLIKNRMRQKLLQGYKKKEILLQSVEYTEFLNELLVEQHIPADIVKLNNEFKKYFDKGDIFLGHNYTYAQQIAKIDIQKFWKSLDIPILIIVGELDYMIDYDEHISLYNVLSYNENGIVHLLSSPIDHFFSEKKTGFSLETVNGIYNFYNNIISLNSGTGEV